MHRGTTVRSPRATNLPGVKLVAVELHGTLAALRLRFGEGGEVLGAGLPTAFDWAVLTHPLDLPPDTYAVRPDGTHAVAKQSIGTVHGFTGFDLVNRDGHKLGAVETGVDQVDTTFVTNYSLLSTLPDHDLDAVHLAAHYISSYTDRPEFRARHVMTNPLRHAWENLYELKPFDPVGRHIKSYRGPTSKVNRISRWLLDLRNDPWALFTDGPELPPPPAEPVRSNGHGMPR